MSARFWGWLCVLASAALASSAQADPPTEAREPTRVLRQITLDLAGRPPTEAEYAAVVASGRVDDAAIERLLASDEHRSVLRDYHRLLLEDTLAQLPQLAAVPNVLAPARLRGGDDAPWYGRNAARFRRGAVQLSCVDVRHDRFAPDGSAIPLDDTWVQGASVANAAGDRSSTIFAGSGASCTRASPCRMDGWVEVEPYWAPGTTLRVCAFDAQTTARGVGVGGRDLACDPRDGNPGGIAPSPSCGCGEHLAYCVPASLTPAGRLLRASIEDEPLHLFEDVVTNHRDYFDALTTRSTFVNGPLATYLRGTGGGVVYALGADVPALPWNADWTRVDRGPAHSGVLTTMAYLARFTSQRSRVQRFRQAFRCEEFASITLPPTEAQPPIDLAQRAGCNGCHGVLEPLTQHWGRFRINLDYGLVDDGTASYATVTSADGDPIAARCARGGRGGGACPPYCDLYYFTMHNTPEYDRSHVGDLQVTAFDWGEPGTDDDRARFDGGPAALVAEGLARPSEAEASPLELCAIRARAESLLHRPLTDAERERWVPELLRAFTASGVHDFISLERAIVTSGRYRGPSGL